MISDSRTWELFMKNFLDDQLIHGAVWSPMNLWLAIISLLLLFIFYYYYTARRILRKKKKNFSTTIRCSIRTLLDAAADCWCWWWWLWWCWWLVLVLLAVVVSLLALLCPNATSWCFSGIGLLHDVAFPTSTFKILFKKRKKIIYFFHREINIHFTVDLICHFFPQEKKE